MKKILVIVAVLAISVSSFAQVKFGAKVGVNFANGTGDDFEDTDMRTSVLFGGFARFALSDKIAFQPELLYSGQGVKESYSEEGMDVDGTLKLDYLNIPLMFKYYAGSGFNIQAGPQVGFLMSAKYKMEAGGESADIDVKDEMKGLDFGLNIGLGYDLESGIGIDARYGLGLSNVADYDEADGKNNVISLAVSYTF